MKTDNNNISQLRPLSEAGPVPEGCVRVRAWKDQEGKWFYGWQEWEGDTHFADIRLPDEPAEKPDPLVTKSDSSPEWAPQAGDVVRLKSGGPLMAISGFRFNGDVVCRWFEHFTPHNGTFEFCCLEPAAKENAR